MEPRFLVAPEHWHGRTVHLPEGELYHARRVMRLSPGDTVVVFDGHGREARARIDVLHRGAGTLVLLEAPQDAGPPGLQLVLGQGLPKAKKIEDIVEDATELGVSRVVPLTTRRSVAHLEGERAADRAERWRRLAQASAKQCARADVPTVDDLTALPDFLEAFRAEEGALGLVLWEEARADGGLGAVLAGEAPSAVWILVGPEGGLTAGEVAQARAAGFVGVGLGPRILRTETAGPAILAILQARWGDLAG